MAREREGERERGNGRKKWREESDKERTGDEIERAGREIEEGKKSEMRRMEV